MTSQEPFIRLDPRSPLVFDTTELGRRPGMMRKVHRNVPAPAELGTEVVGVPEGADVQVDLRLEAVMEGVLVSGTARGASSGECVRCLDRFERELEVEFQELFTYPGKSPDSDDDDLHELQGELIALEPVLRDAVVLALPFQPVCRTDCPGLCSECGAHLAGDPDHHHDSADPRWAALAGVLKEHPTASHDEKKEG